MGRRAEHSRDEQRDMALAAARNIVEKEGLRGLSARRVARHMGYTIGTIYNLFDNLDDLITHMNGRTLDDLYEAVRAQQHSDGPAQPGGTEAALRGMAQAYIRYTGDNPKTWNALFEHQLPDGQAQPEWHLVKVLRLLGLVELTLAPLYPGDQHVERLHAARVLWSGLHGICSLASANKLPFNESVDDMADTLITNYVAGLVHLQGAKTEAPIE